MDSLAKFRRNTYEFTPTKPHKQIFFQLNFDEVGAFIKVVDKKGQPIEIPNNAYDPAIKDVLRSMNFIRESNQFQIDWDHSSDQVYLSQNDYLLDKLSHTNNLVNESMEPIQFADGHHRMQILIVPDTDKKEVQCQLILHHTGQKTTQNNVLLVTNRHVFSANAIYPIAPLSENFLDLHKFEGIYPAGDLENYLSIFYSHFEDVEINYLDYQAVPGREKRTQETLIFEQIDQEENIHMRISPSIDGMDVDFFTNYYVQRIVVLNEMDKTIQISPIVENFDFSCRQKVRALLNKNKKANQGQSDSDYLVEDNLFIIQKNLAKSFLHNDFSAILSNYPVYGAEKLKTFKIKNVIPQLKVSMTHGIDFLEGDAHLEIEGEEFTLYDALQQYRKKTYIQLNDGTHAIINQSYMNKLERLFKRQDDQVKISFFDLPAVEELIDEKTVHESFSQSREIFLGFNQLNKKKTRLPKVKATLRPYQKQGYEWLKYLHTHSLGGCLADDMGLGKTLQTIALLSLIYPKEKRTSLIVMPKSLVFNWEKELVRFNPELSFYVYYGANRDLSKGLEHHLILTTYAMLRNNIEEFKEEKFHYVILDESQNIKNVQSQTSKAAVLLDAQYRLALSGTPIENNLSELYALFRFLNPSMFGSLDEFNRFYLNPIQQFNDKQVMHELKRKIYPFILRRLKKEVLTDLPDKIETILYVEMSASQKKHYNQRLQFYKNNLKVQIAENGIQKSQLFIFQALNELRQIASIPESQTDNKIISPKRELLLDQILEATANNHKILVFGNFLSIMEHVGDDLAKAGIDYQVITGATRDRGAIVEQFQEDPACKVLLMTLKTGGLGLNLTQADTVFIFDPWWNLAAENQAIDRSHRIGQDKTVFSYKMITRETIEEKILLLQEKKRELFDNVISSDSASLKSLNEEDLNYIFN